ncbi:hypothetical protein OV079_50760 [Nannocystis pusilla]|uniref:Uncharacterized protein n=1 Tax=Nannocystis pusilla TaxID=889268 RepID=A0A9X3J4A6_9BACT|nr:hypothetical protein [Nannocystis pusilla]MCY1013679.1 hypothetical protein [Nannocystis pusilla]
MGSDLYRVKVVSKKAATAVFDVKVIHPDISTIPEDRSFALMLLREAAKDSLLAREVATADKTDKTWLKKYASGFIPSVALKCTGNSAKRGRLTVTVSDPAWIDHVKPGESFDTAAFQRIDKYDRHPPILATKGAAEPPGVDGAALDDGFLWVPREAFGDVRLLKPLPRSSRCRPTPSARTRSSTSCRGRSLPSGSRRGTARPCGRWSPAGRRKARSGS